MRDADQVEAWISTQESFIAGDDYGVSTAHTVLVVQQQLLLHTGPIYSSIHPLWSCHAATDL